MFLFEHGCSRAVVLQGWSLRSWAAWASPGNLVVVQTLSRVRLFETPWTAIHQASLSFTISRSLLRVMSIESVMPPDHLILCHPLLLPSIFPSIRIFSNELALHIRWPNTGTSASASILPMNIQGGFPLGGLISLRSRYAHSQALFQKPCRWGPATCVFPALQAILSLAKKGLRNSEMEWRPTISSFQFFSSFSAHCERLLLFQLLLGSCAPAFL